MHNHNLASRGWVMSQAWDDLLFAHWPVDPAQLAPLVKPPLEIDTTHSHAWLGVVAFRISRIQLRGLPVVAAVSNFPEVNLRTYVRLNDRPWFRLPYRHAEVCLAHAAKCTEFVSRSPEHADFAAAYAPTSPAGNGDDELGRWLTERFCYYTQSARGTYRCDIAHQPWPLTGATATVATNTLPEPFGLDLPATRPLLHAARHMDTRVWPLLRVA